MYKQGGRVKTKCLWLPQSTTICGAIDENGLLHMIHTIVYCGDHTRSHGSPPSFATLHYTHLYFFLLRTKILIKDTWCKALCPFLCLHVWNVITSEKQLGGEAPYPPAFTTAKD